MIKQRHDQQLPLGLDYDGYLLKPTEVPRGRACSCVCPGCLAPLVAKVGTKRRPHFAHQPSSFCQTGYETVLHLWGKKILLEAAEVRLPADAVEFARQKKEVCSAETIRVDGGKEKDWLFLPNGRIKPDVTLFSGGRAIHFEVFVSNKVKERKRDLYAGAECFALQLDLSFAQRSLVAEDLLEDVLKTGYLLDWIAHPGRVDAMKGLRLEIEQQQATVATRDRAKASHESAPAEEVDAERVTSPVPPNRGGGEPRRSSSKRAAFPRDAYSGGGSDFARVDRWVTEALEGVAALNKSKRR